jgi:hypothetical protein
MSKKPIRRPLGALPAARSYRTPPALRRVAAVPGGDPAGRTPAPHVARVPKPHAIGKPPNPRKPKLVRDVGGGPLMDLFAIFPDLPRPRRPAPRLRGRRKARRR